MTYVAPEAKEQVLSTLNRDGSRRWLRPKLSEGKHLRRRRVVAYTLILIFTAVPYVSLNGKPLFLLDVIERQFHLFGGTFYATDTFLLMLFAVTALVGIFLLTAVFGRVWCGWGCPQTVYMEFLYRPLERWIEGGRGKQLALDKSGPNGRRILRYFVFFLVSMFLAHTFLAYFVGVDSLSQWMTQSPLKHPVPFAVMAFVTFAMMVDFCYFREQMCLIACPYGRFQSVLLDQNSLIVAYDKDRGEPRGKLQKNTGDTLPILGDCINCHKCVTTCPTGIDIRDGLQMECINCTQCIDACNAVMDKIGRPQNLIRYSSQAKDSGLKPGLVRARTLIYPVLILGLATAFFTVFLSSKSFDAVLLREPGNPYTLTDEGEVRNILKLKITNRTNQPMEFTLEAASPTTAKIELRESHCSVDPESAVTFHASVVADKSDFELGRANLQINISNQDQERRTLNFKLIGPYN